MRDLKKTFFIVHSALIKTCWGPERTSCSEQFGDKVAVLRRWGRNAGRVSHMIRSEKSELAIVKVK